MDTWEPYIQTFLIGSFPWISQLKKLDIHFTRDDINIRAINNFFASLFAMAIFIYITESTPDLVAKLPEWFYFILISLVLSIIFVINYIYFKDDVMNKEKQHFIVMNLIIYIFLFCSLTTGFGILKVYSKYYVFKGEIVDSRTEENVSDALIQIIGKDDSILDKTKSNEQGKFNILIFKEEYEKCNKLEVLHNDYREETEYFLAKSAMDDVLEKIKLDPHE